MPPTQSVGEGTGLPPGGGGQRGRGGQLGRVGQLGRSDLASEERPADGGPGTPDRRRRVPPAAEVHERSAAGAPSGASLGVDPSPRMPVVSKAVDTCGLCNLG